LPRAIIVECGSRRTAFRLTTKHQVNMRTLCSSDDWNEVQVFWEMVLGFHDAVLTFAEHLQSSATVTMEFSDVLTCEPDGDFRVMYPKLKVFLSGADVADFRRVLDAVGNDVVTSELLRNELWIKTMGGSFVVRFTSLRFISA
jgi:hypothetical protein